MIADEVECSDIENYALACRRFYKSAAQPLSRHQGLLKRYGRLSNRPRLADARYVNLPNQFREILDDPKLAFYIRSLVLTDMASQWTSHGQAYPRRNLRDGEHSIDGYARHSGFRTSPVVLKMDDWKEDGDQVWQSCYKEGSEEIMAGLMISQLPHLSKLEIKTDDLPGVEPRPNHILGMFRRMSRKNYSWIICRINELYWPRPKQHALHTDPLSRLTTVVLFQDRASTSRYGKPTTRTVDLLLFFTTLPSVKTVHAQKPGEWQDTHPTMRPEQGSNVSSLTIARGLLNPGFLENILQDCHNLSQFSYSNPEDERVPLQSVNNALSKHTSDTLQSVTLGSSHVVTGHIQSTSWGRFKALSYMSIDIRAFLPYVVDVDQGSTRFFSPQSTISILRQHMPHSLRALRLSFHQRGYYSCRAYSLIEELRLLKDIMEAEGRVLPQMETLELAFRFEKPEDEELEVHEHLQALESASERVHMALAVFYECSD